jgi:XisI protein
MVRLKWGYYLTPPATGIRYFELAGSKKSGYYGVLIHIDLKGETIWIQYDGTEVGVANELVEQGIPKEDIVLAYHSEFIRQYDGFAVG